MWSRNSTTSTSAPRRRQTDPSSSPMLAASIPEPPRQLSILRLGEGRVEVIDRDGGRRDQDRLGVGERVKAVLSIIVAHARAPGPAERHGLHDQVDIDQLQTVAAARELA